MVIPDRKELKGPEETQVQQDSVGQLAHPVLTEVREKGENVALLGPRVTVELRASVA
jgi:hypothetical protein